MLCYVFMIWLKSYKEFSSLDRVSNWILSISTLITVCTYCMYVCLFDTWSGNDANMYRTWRTAPTKNIIIGCTHCKINYKLRHHEASDHVYHCLFNTVLTLKISFDSSINSELRNNGPLYTKSGWPETDWLFRAAIRYTQMQYQWNDKKILRTLTYEKILRTVNKSKLNLKLNDYWVEHDAIAQLLCLCT